MGTLVVTPALALVGSASAQSFIGRGDMPGGPVKTVADGISADGGVVIGDARALRVIESFDGLWKQG
jgi:hypothetical protein